MMIAFLCIFFPAVIALWLLEALNRRRLDRRTWLYRYCGYALAINFLCLAIKRFVFRNAMYPLYELATDMIPSTAVNYLLMALPIAVGLVLAEVIIQRVFHWEITTIQPAVSSKNRIVRCLLTILCILGLFISFLAFFAARWYIDKYGNIGFDSILFSLLSDLKGLQSGLITSFLLAALMPAVLCTGIFAFLLLYPARKKVRLSLFGKKPFTVYPICKILRIVLAIVLCLALIITAAWQADLINYLKQAAKKSTIFEEQYAEPSQVNIQFPAKKRNVIHIMLESMENTFFSKSQGGALDVCVIPELYSLAQENINFSHNNGVGGFLPAAGTRYTSAAMVSQSSGTPFLPPSVVDPLEYGGESFLPGLTTMMDILHDNGYDQSLLVGSYASYGGRKTYYLQHGTDRVYELETARADGIVPADYSAWWGMEDEYVYDYAQRILPEIAAGDKPFFLTLLTTDTHHVGGYVCNLCGNEYEEQYENVFACASVQVTEFLKWLQAQDFYEDTLIVISGDHLSMDSGYFTRNVSSDYERTVYNCFINASADAVQQKNRSFCAMDMTPTILAAMGCTIEGERLGLGTNLFSSKPTLIEEMGFNDFNNQLCRTSDYYTTHFFFD